MSPLLYLHKLYVSRNSGMLYSFSVPTEAGVGTALMKKCAEVKIVCGHIL